MHVSPLYTNPEAQPVGYWPKSGGPLQPPGGLEIGVGVGVGLDVTGQYTRRTASVSHVVIVM